MTDPHIKDMIKQREQQLAAHLYEAEILKVDIERLKRRLGEERATTSSYKHSVLLSTKGING
jgi:regulator of replication initiation timing